jgi:hypothetical protein
MRRAEDELKRPLLGDEDAEAGGSGEPRDVDDAAVVRGASAKELSPLTQVCPFILANEFCERLAYYGLASNLVTYFTGTRRWRRLAKSPVFCRALRSLRKKPLTRIARQT